MVKSLKDIKIMQNIVEDARIPISILAKKTRLSREVVQYRLKNLEKSIIASYQARLNLSIFSDSVYTLFLNIHGLERKDIFLRLKKLPNAHWIGSTLGRWNYIVSFSVNEKSSLNNFLDVLSGLFNKDIMKYVLTQQIKEYKDSFAGLFNKNLIISSQEIGKKEKVDEFDEKIIDLLAKNARISNAEIADKVNLTRESVRLRIKNLEKSKVILNYRTLIRPQELDLITFVLAISCKHTKSEELSKLCNFLCSEGYTSYVCTSAGEINILSVLSVKSIRDLDDICNKLRERFSEILEEVVPLPLIEVGSQEYLPK